MQGVVCVCVCSQAGGCVCVRAWFSVGAWPWARAREARGARTPARLERERERVGLARPARPHWQLLFSLSVSLNSAPDAAGPPTPSLPAGACPPARAHRPRGGGVRDGEEGQGRRGRKACGRACFFFFSQRTPRPLTPRPRTPLSRATRPPSPPFQTSGSAEFEGGVGAATFRAPAAPARPKQTSRGRPGVAAFEGGTGKAMFASR